MDPDTKARIIAHMKKMPLDKEELMLQCALHLQKNNTLGALLAVVHALNDEAIFMRYADDEETDLASEFERILDDGDKKK
jgi:hypothetical protein